MATAINLPHISILATSAEKLATAASENGNTARANAVNKAMFQLHTSNVQIIPTAGGLLVASATRASTVHRISHVHGCGCEAGAKGRDCWHASLLLIIEDASTRVYPSIDLDKAARNAKIEAEMAELFN